MIRFHAATLAQRPARALIDKLRPNIGLTDGRIGSRLRVNLHHVPVGARVVSRRREGQKTVAVARKTVISTVTPS
jgi:hypothetical protein